MTEKALVRADVEDRKPEVVSFEKNIEASYLFAGAAAKGSGKVREYVRKVTLPDGRVATRRERFTPSEELGDLHDFDRDVYVAMWFLAQMRGGMQPDGRVRFSLYDVVNILNLPDNGKSYRIVRDSILRQQKLLIDADMYSKETRSYESEHFTVWRVNFKANVDKHGRARENHTLKFDEVMVRSYQDGYIKEMDVNFYFALDEIYARPLYTRIDVERESSLKWTARLSELKVVLDMAESYKYPSQISRALQPAHEELTRKGFLKSFSFPEKDVVIYEVAEEFVSQRQHPERRWTVEENEAVRNLIREGVWANVARELVIGRGAEVCNFYVKALPYQKNVRDPGAWLRKYIHDRLPLPVEPPQRRLDEADVAQQHEGRARASADPVTEALLSPPEPDPHAQEVWDLVLGDVEEQIDVSSLRVWFEGTVAVGLESGTLTISVPNIFAKDYIETRFNDLLESSLKQRLSKKASLHVVVGAQPTQ
jgi:plasmid replication initiation protein